MNDTTIIANQSIDDMLGPHDESARFSLKEKERITSPQLLLDKKTGYNTQSRSVNKDTQHKNPFNK